MAAYININIRYANQMVSIFQEVSCCRCLNLKLKLKTTSYKREEIAHVLRPQTEDYALDKLEGPGDSSENY